MNLTPRQHQVLQAVADSLTNGQAAALLNTSVKTVESERLKIQQSMKVDNITSAVLKGVASGIVVNPFCNEGSKASCRFINMEIKLSGNDARLERLIKRLATL